MRRSLAALVLLFAAACSKDKDKPRDTREELGEPIGAQVPAAGKQPSMSIALAVSKGSDPVAMLAPFVDGITKAVAKCPDFTDELRAHPFDPAGFEFAVETGKVKLTGRTDPSPGTKCFAAAFEGKEIGAPSMPRVTGRTEILLRPSDDAGQP